MFTLENACIHAGSAYQNNVYILNLICRYVRRFVLRKVRMHTSSTHWSSVYLIKYALATSGCCCSVLGSGYYFLVTLFWWQHSEWSYWLWFKYGLLRWLIDSVVVDSESDDWASVIGWYRCIWWLNFSYDVIDGSSLKIYETWSLEEERRS